MTAQWIRITSPARSRRSRRTKKEPGSKAADGEKQQGQEEFRKKHGIIVTTRIQGLLSSGFANSTRASIPCLARRHPMFLIFPFFLLLGLFLPGYFLAKYLRHPLWWASAFPISLLVLFHSVFWLGLFHIPITLWSVLPCLVAATAGAAWLARRSGAPAKSDPTPTFPRQDLILISSSGLVGAVLLVRSAISPLIGYRHTVPLGFPGAENPGTRQIRFLSAAHRGRLSHVFLRGWHSAPGLVHPLVVVRLGRRIPAGPDLSVRDCPVCVHAGVHLRRGFGPLFAARRHSRSRHACRVPAFLPCGRPGAGHGTDRAFHRSRNLLHRHRKAGRRRAGDGVGRPGGGSCAHCRASTAGLSSSRAPSRSSGDGSR